MKDCFEIINLTASDIEFNQELDGIMPKAWVQTKSLGKVLFKEAASDREYIAESRTDWSEKVVSEINRLVELPSARYYLATLTDGNQIIPGTVSVDLAGPKDEERFPLEKLLLQSIDKYDDASDYQVDNVVRVLLDNNIGLPPHVALPKGINNAADMFVGVLMMDAAVGNSDRHDRNLDIVRQIDGKFYLSPVFDQGYSLGAVEDNDLRSWISPWAYNKYHNVSSFISRGNYINVLEAFKKGASLRPQAAKIWLKKLQKVEVSKLKQIFEKLPEQFVSLEAQKFAINLFEHNRKQILDLNLTIIESNKQQERVEKIAPILIDYIRLHQNSRIETKISVIKFDSANKIITYEDKDNRSEYLKARYVDRKWLSIDTNISERKESYFLNYIAPKIVEKQAQIRRSSLRRSNKR